MPPIAARVLLSLATTALVLGCGPTERRSNPLPSERAESAPSEPEAPNVIPAVVWDKGATVPAHPLEAAPDSRRLVVHAPEGAPVAGMEWQPIVVRIEDGQGGLSATAEPTVVTVLVSDGTGVLMGSTTKVAAGGVAVFSDLVYTVAETMNFDVEADGGFAGVERNVSVTVESAPAAALTVTGYDELLTAGEALTLNVTAYDAFGNVATGYRGTVNVATGDPMTSTTGPYTFTAADAGSATLEDAITLRTAGHWVVQVADRDHEDLSAAGGAVITVKPGKATTLDLTGVPLLTAAGAPLSMTVTTRDAFGNEAEGFTGAVSIATTDPHASVPEPFVLSGAKATFEVTLRTSGEQAVVAEMQGGYEGQAQNHGSAPAIVDVLPGPPAAVQLVNQPTAGVAGEALTPSPTVLITDGWGNVAETDAPVSLVVVNGTGGLGGATIIKATGGVAAFDAVYVTHATPNVTLAATVPGLGSVHGAPFEVLESTAASLAKLQWGGAAPEAIEPLGRGAQIKAWVSGFTGVIGQPAGLCADTEGNVYVGQSPGKLPVQPVLKLTPEAEALASAPVPTPHAVATTGDGALLVGGGDAVWGPLESFGADPVDAATWAVFAGADIRDLEVDNTVMAAYVADSAENDGRVIAMDQVTHEAKVLMAPGDEVSLAVHPQTHDLYVVTRNGGDLYRVDTGTGDGSKVTWLDTWDVARVERIAFHTVGKHTQLYATLRTDTDAGIARWDPAEGAGSLEWWVVGMQATPPTDLACRPTAAGGALYVTAGTQILELSCRERDADVSPGLRVNEPGHTIAVAATLTGPAAAAPYDIALDAATGYTVIVDPTTAAVRAVDSDGEIIATDPVPAATAVALDSAGYAYVGGNSNLYRAALADFGEGGEWHLWHQAMGGIAGLAVDQAHGDSVYVAYTDGRVTRIDQDGGSAVVLGPGPGARITLDAAGDLWVLRDSGALLRVDRVSLEVLVQTSLAALQESWAGANAMTWGPDGRLYVATALSAPERSVIMRWDPAAPNTVEEWARVKDASMPGYVPAEHDDDAFDLEFVEGDPCLWLSSPLTARLHRLCECD